MRIGDTVTATLTVAEINVEKRRVHADTVCTVRGRVVVEGRATHGRSPAGPLLEIGEQPPDHGGRRGDIAAHAADPHRRDVTPPGLGSVAWKVP